MRPEFESVFTSSQYTTGTLSMFASYKANGSALIAIFWFQIRRRVFDKSLTDVVLFVIVNLFVAVLEEFHL